MGDYQHDMSGEKAPAQLLPEGARLVRVTEVIASVSKKGNEMFITSIEDVKTHKSMQVFMVTEKGKRWMLKSLLTACELPAGQDHVYDWSVKDVIGKSVIAIIEHVQEPWTNREGVEVTTTKAKVTEFIQAEKDTTGQPCAWED